MSIMNYFRREFLLEEECEFEWHYFHIEFYDAEKFGYRSNRIPLEFDVIPDVGSFSRRFATRELR